MLSQLIEVVKKNDYVKVGIAVVLGFLFLKFFYLESLENVEEEPVEAPVEAPVVEAPPVVGSSELTPEEQTTVDAVVAPSANLTTEDLLPKTEEGNAFLEQNPVAKLLKEQDLLVSGYHIGINTQVQSNKIPYYDLRSAPPIPKENVGPWSQSSYEQPAGAKRRELEIGA